MTDVNIPAAARGRSLWADAWNRLKANKAAMVSLWYLAFMGVLCIVGPWFTPHDFTTIYQDYTRVPPSLEAYPRPDAIDLAVKDAVQRSRLDLAGWEEKDGKVLITVTSAKPIDPRVTRYIDRSDVFKGTQVTQTSDDKLKMTMSADIKHEYFFFGTDNNGRDLLTRTLIAGRVSLAIGLLAGLVAVVIGVLYGAVSGFTGGKTDEVMMRIVDVLYSLPFIFFVIMLVVFFGRNFVLMFLAVGAVLWLDMARIVRGQALSLKRQEYVHAAEALGVSPGGILLRHVVPNLLGIPKSQLNDIRGARITMIFQEPMTSLDPLYTVGDQLIEPIRKHQRLGEAEARARAVEMLRLVRIPEPERRMRSYPHEMSGGQRQRVMIAMALANNPDLLIADEPTTALDVTIQAEILELMASLQQRLGMGMVFITHDLNIVKRIAHRVYVMRRGEVVEEGETAELFAHPKHPYTRALLEAEPTGRKLPVAPNARKMIDATDLRVTFKLGGGFMSGPPLELRAVDRVSMTLRQGQTIGIVGESGSGKSTFARAVLRLLPSEGAITFENRSIQGLTREQMRPLRRELQIVLQDPFGSLSPRMTAGQIVTEGLLVHEPSISRAERDRRAAQALEEVQLDPSLRNRYPHEFSGGQRQRIAIARAIILKPKVVVLDEPTSALDRQVQKQIVDLLRELQQANNLSYLFISHDLAVVRAMADHIMVMKDGRLVEQGTPDEVLEHPREDYTRRLMAAAFAD